jgi:fumarate hydratase, class I
MFRVLNKTSSPKFLKFYNKKFEYKDLFQKSKDTTPYRLVTKDFVSTQKIKIGNEEIEILKVEPEGITKLTEEAMSDIQYLLRPQHLQQLSNILKDKESSSNDTFVAKTLLKNAVIASGRNLPGCQDTGTAIVMVKLEKTQKKGQTWTIRFHTRK